MPHSNFKERSHTFNSGVENCSCGQTFDYASERDWSIKFWLHCKVCPNPPEGSKLVMISRKAMTLRDHLNNKAERMRRVHE